MEGEGNAVAVRLQVELHKRIVSAAKRDASRPDAAPVLRQLQKGRAITLPFPGSVVVVIAQKHIAIVWPKRPRSPTPLCRFGVSCVCDIHVSVLSFHDRRHAIDAHSRIAEFLASPAWHDGDEQQGGVSPRLES